MGGLRSQDCHCQLTDPRLIPKTRFLVISVRVALSPDLSQTPVVSDWPGLIRSLLVQASVVGRAGLRLVTIAPSLWEHGEG